MASIMIIDDDIELAETLQDILTRGGYETQLMDTTDGAIEVLSKAKPDLLLLDVMFPDSPSAGFDLARAIRAAEPIKDLPIILLTAVNQEFPMGFSEADIDADWMPVQHFVEKPVSPAELLNKVKSTLSPNA